MGACYSKPQNLNKTKNKKQKPKQQQNHNQNNNTQPQNLLQNSEVPLRIHPASPDQINKPAKPEKPPRTSLILKSTANSTATSTQHLPAKLFDTPDSNNPRKPMDTYQKQNIRGPLAQTIPNQNVQIQDEPVQPVQNLEEPEQAILPIVIEKPRALITPEASRVPTYHTIRTKRGKSLIINNTDFPNDPNKHNRPGSEFDAQNMFNLLGGLGLEPISIPNLTSTEITQTLEEFASAEDLYDVDLCVIVIMSFGKGTSDTMTEICGVDEEYLSVYQIYAQFAENYCPALKGKPKIFIFQCSRDSEEKYGIEFDLVTDDKPARCGDTYIAYSSMPGTPSTRNIELGSYFIREICKVFAAHACDMHVEELFKMVKDNVKRMYQLEIATENKSFDHCYLNPV